MLAMQFSEEKIGNCRIAQKPNQTVRDANPVTQASTPSKC